MQHFLSEHVALVGIVDSQPQRIAFYVFVVAIVMGSSLFSYLGRTLERLRPDREVLLGILVTVVGAFVVIAAVMTLPSLAGLVAAMVLAAACALARERRGVNMLWAGAVILVILAIAPGFLGTPVIDHEALRWSDFHYAAVLAHGERLAAGRLLFGDNEPDYGVFIPILIGLFSKFSHAPSFYELMRWVQAGQSLCLVAFVIAAWLRTRGSPTGGRALAMFLVTLTVVPGSEILARPSGIPINRDFGSSCFRSPSSSAACLPIRDREHMEPLLVSRRPLQFCVVWKRA